MGNNSDDDFTNVLKNVSLFFGILSTVSTLIIVLTPENYKPFIKGVLLVVVLMILVMFVFVAFEDD